MSTGGDDILALRLVGDATQFDRVIKESEKKIDKVAKSLTAAATRAEQQAQAMMLRGAQVTRSMMTATEHYRAEMSELRKLLKAEAIDQETFNRAQEQARQILPSVQKAQEKHNRALELAKKIKQSMVTPEQEHNRYVLQLNNLLKASLITQKEYDAEVAKSAETLPKNVTAMKALEQEQDRLNQLMEEGRRITMRQMTAVDQYRSAQARLDEMLREGAITTKAYDQELKDLKRMLPAVQEAERRTAEAEQLHNQQMTRGRQLVQSLLTPEQHYAQAQQELNQLLAAKAISYSEYLQLLAKESQKLPEVIKAQKLYDDQMERGKQIHLQSLNPIQNYIKANKELKDLLKAGAITQQEHDAALQLEKNKLPEVQAALQRYTQAVQRGKDLTDQLRRPMEVYRDRLRELQSLYRDGHLGQQAYTRGLRQLAVEFQRVGPLAQRLSQGMRSFGGSARMGGMLGSLFVTAPITAFAATSQSAFREFDKAMTNSLSIATEADKRFRGEMEKTAKSISEKGVFSATELADAYYQMISAGYSAEQSLKGMKVAEDFATAGSMNLEQSVKMLAKAQNAMGMAMEDPIENMKQMQRVADVLAQGANSTLASIGELTEALVNAAAPAAKMLGYSIEETVGALEVYIQKGASMATASEHLAIGLRLTQQAFAKHRDGWKQLGQAAGINANIYDQATGKIKPFADIVEMLTTMLGRLSDEERVNALEALGFEALQQRAILPLIGEAEAMRKNTEALKKQGEAARIANEQRKSYDAQIKMTEHVFQNLRIEIGQMLAPTILQLGKYLRAGVEWFRALSEKAKMTAIVVAGLAAAAGPLLIAFGTFVGLAATVVAGFASIATAVVTIGAPIALAVVGIVALGAAVVAVAGTMAAFMIWPEQMATITEKTVRIAERIWMAFKGWLAGVWDRFWSVEFQFKLITGLNIAGKTLSKFALKITEMMGAAMNPVEWAKYMTGKKSAFDWDSMVDMKQLEADAARGMRSLSGAIGTILKEELGLDIPDAMKKAKDKLDEELGKMNEGLDKTRKMAEDALAGMGDAAGGAKERFTSLKQELLEMNTKFEEQIALERKALEMQKAAGTKDFHFSEHQREVFKFQYKMQKQMADGIKELTDRFGEGSPQVKAYQEQMEKMTKELLSQAQANADLLDSLEKQRKEMEELENLTKKFESPAQKFAREVKDLKKVFDAGKITTKQYQKELHKLRDDMMKQIKIDFQIHGVEGVEAGTAQAAAALENFLTMQDMAKRPIDMTTGQPKPPPAVAAAGTAAKGKTTVTKAGKTAKVAIPVSPAARRAAELARRETRARKREFDKAFANNGEGTLEEGYKKFQEKYAEGVRVDAIRQKAAANREAARAGAGTDKEDDRMLKPLMEIAKNTATLAKKKSITVESANL